MKNKILTCVVIVLLQMVLQVVQMGVEVMMVQNARQIGAVQHLRTLMATTTEDGESRAAGRCWMLTVNELI